MKDYTLFAGLGVLEMSREHFIGSEDSKTIKRQGISFSPFAKNEEVTG